MGGRCKREADASELTNSPSSRSEAFTFVGIAALISVLEVVVGQNTGDDDTGGLIGTPVVEPHRSTSPSSLDA